MIILAILLIGLVWPSSPACVDGRPSVVNEYNSSPLIFTGEVVSEEATEESEDYIDGTTYKLKVIELIRGTDNQFVDIFSENSSERFPMRIGNKYVLFVYESEERIQVDNCGNSGILSKNNTTLATLRELKEMEQVEGKN